MNNGYVQFQVHLQVWVHKIVLSCTGFTVHSWPGENTLAAVSYLLSGLLQDSSITPILGSANILHGWWLHRGPQKNIELSKLGGGCFHGTCMALA